MSTNDIRLGVAIDGDQEAARRIKELEDRLDSLIRKGKGSDITPKADASRTNRELGKVEKKLQDVNKRAVDAGKVFLSGFAVAGAGMFAKQSTEIASSVGEQFSKVGVVFGKNAKDVQAWSDGTSRSMGVSKLAALTAAGQFGTLFSTMGIGSKANAGMSKSLVALAADMASFNDANPAEVLEALRSGLVGESEPLRRFGVNLSAAQIQAEAMTSGLVKTKVNLLDVRAAQLKVSDATRANAEATKKHGATSREAMGTSIAVGKAEEQLQKALGGTKVELTDAQKAQATYQLLMKKTTLQQGDFARTSNSLANQQRIANALFNDASGQIGTKLIPILLGATKGFIGMVGWAQRNSTTLKVMAGIVGGLASAFLIYTAAAKADIAVRAVWTTVTGSATVAQGGLNAAMKANTIGLVVVAIAALIGGLVVAYKKSETFRAMVQATGHAGKVAISWIGDAAVKVGGFFVSLWNKTRPLRNGIVEMGRVGKAAFDLWTSPIRLIARLIGALPGTFRAAGSAIKTGFNAALNGIGSGLVNMVMRPLRATAKFLVDHWPNVWGFPGPPGGLISLAGSSGSVQTGLAPVSDQNGGGIGLRTGGVVPGPRGAGDIIPAMLSPGEVVLNQRQQSRIGVGRILNVLATTGGRVGGNRFASGGIAGGAYSFATSQLGEPYVWGAGHSYGDSRGWDCSGFASNVAARVPGYTGGIGTTMSLYPKSKPARGNEPVVFGFLGMGQSNPAKQHMGIRVNGQWFEAAGGGRGVIRGRSSWSSGLRVPPGLENLSTDSTIGGNPSAGEAPIVMTPSARRAMRGISKAGKAPTAGNTEALVRSTTLSTSRAVLRDPFLSASEKSSVMGERVEDAVRNAELKYWKDHDRKARARLKRITKDLKTITARLRKAAIAGDPNAVAALSQRRSQLTKERRGLATWLGEIRKALVELNYAAAQDQIDDELSAMTESESGGNPRDAATTTAAQFLSATFGTGDISRTGQTAWTAGTGLQNLFLSVQSLTPDGPNTLAAIGDAVGRAINQAATTPSPVTVVGA